MLDVADFELAAVRTAFCHLVARWRLSQGELRDLLVIDQVVSGHRVLPDVLDEDGETRARLLLRLDRAISSLCQGADVGALMRDVDPVSGSAPLADLRDIAVLRASVRVAELEVGSAIPAIPMRDRWR